MTKLRVAHFGTGHTGEIALRQILRTPDLELVGHLVHSPEKAGRDSGALVGEAPVGVLATTSFDEFLALDADCVTYFATEYGRGIDEVIEQMCQLLASGKNIVTTTYVRLVYPPSLDAATLARLETACAAGHSSFFGTGIAPGFTTDTLAVHCASLSRQVKQVKIDERILCGTYRDPLTFVALGFGRTPEQDAELHSPGAWAPHFAGTMHMLADGLGWRLDDIQDRKDVAVTDHDIVVAGGAIPQGTIASVRLGFVGMVDGEPRLSISLIYAMTDDPVDTWDPRLPPGSSARRFTELEIDGDPRVNVTLNLDGGDLPGSDATATRAVNAIAAVCAAPAGVHSALDLVVGGNAGLGGGRE